jgi:2-dehydro-3-deoxyphosphogluconate aldolase/(4S)-4-hydroxy-2-oxoglutarate aldolase
LKEEVIETANRYGVLAIPGIFTPSEALRAWELGALLVKVFPASVLGPGFIRSLKAPLPQLEFLPTGGITVDNAPEYIRAGALAVCVGSALFSPQALRERDYGALERRARQLVQAVQGAQG